MQISTVTLSIRVPKEMHQKLLALSIEENLNLSQYCRKLLEKGLSVDAYKNESDFIASIVRNEINNAFDNWGNRIIKLLIKVGKASGGLLYTTINLIRSLRGQGQLHTLRDLTSESMKMGIAYMKIKDSSIDEHLIDPEKAFDESMKL